MSGDEWQRFANLRLLYGYMFSHPGAKLLFMGNEIGQSNEWNFKTSIDWDLLQYDYHNGVKKCITDLNTLYKNYPALYEKQFSHDGFEWINYGDHQNSVLSYIRKGDNPNENLVIVCNLTPVVHNNYKIGIPKLETKTKLEMTKVKLIEIFNSDNKKYNGSGINNAKPVKIVKKPYNGKDFSAELILSPLGIGIFKFN
jgi:1,4-alpha-glucan branching enzyme